MALSATSAGLWTDADIIDYLQRNKTKIPEGLLPDLASPSIHYFSDSNMNQVALVSDDTRSIIVKHAPPFVRIVGPSWPISTARNSLEAQYLKEVSVHLPGSVPAVYLCDENTMVMEAIHGYESARYALIAGKKLPLLGRHIGHFVAHMSYKTSAFSLSETELAAAAARYINPDPCKITNDLFFTDPYIYGAPSNKFSSPLCLQVMALAGDVALKIEVAALQHKFNHCQEALIHGDLHTGSLLTNEDSTKILDGEFAWYGPVGFDLGVFIANLVVNYLAHFGLSSDDAVRKDYQAYLLTQIQDTWQTFAQEFTALVGTNSERATSFLTSTWYDTLGYAGTECIRRVSGLAQNKDVHDIQNFAQRVGVENAILDLGCTLIKSRFDLENCTALNALVAASTPVIITPHMAHCFLEADELRVAIGCYEAAAGSPQKY